MAKLFKKVQKMIDEPTGRKLRATLVEYNLGNIPKEQAQKKGMIFYETWIGYFEIQHSQAVEENEKRELMENFTEIQKRD